MAKARRKIAKPRRAQAARRSTARKRGMSQDRVRPLIHELQVYTEEIEVQNEQLVKAQQEIEEARDRFADLYDFAPIGYLAVNDSGAITEINLSGAALLGRARAFLLKLPFTALVSPVDRDRLRRFLLHVISSEAKGPPPQIEIRLKKPGNHCVRLIARARRQPHGVDVLLAMIDVTFEKRLEEEREAAFTREQARAAELAREMTERVAAEERVKLLLDRLVSIQEDERRRLSRNLHDHLGQQLTALRLAIGSIKERARGTAEPNSRLGVIESIVSDLDRDIDRLAWDLRPAALDDMGLSAALDTLVREWAQMTGVAAEFHTTTPSPERRLGKEIESHVYRIVQEALTNVAKHAEATRVSVLLKQAREELALIVEDDGHGFQGGTARHTDSGMGLISMRERAALIGGEIQIESLAGQGATVFVKIPLKTITTP